MALTVMCRGRDFDWWTRRSQWWCQ